MTVIRGKELKTFGLAPDGESFAIHVMDEQSRPAMLVLPSECLHELMMTLPEMVRRSLQLRFREQLMRVVYPVGSWDVERGQTPGSAVVTLRTPDGFEVSFGLSALDLFRMWTRTTSGSAEARDTTTN